MGLDKYFTMERITQHVQSMEAHQFIMQLNQHLKSQTLHERFDEWWEREDDETVEMHIKQLMHEPSDPYPGYENECLDQLYTREDILDSMFYSWLEHQHVPMQIAFPDPGLTAFNIARADLEIIRALVMESA
jgi:hypothetical protein